MTTSSLVCVSVAGVPGDTAALAAGMRLANTGAHRLLIVCAADAEQATTTALAALRRNADVPVVERMTAEEQVADTLTRLAPQAQGIVCDRSCVMVNAPSRGLCAQTWDFGPGASISCGAASAEITEDSEEVMKAVSVAADRAQYVAQRRGLHRIHVARDPQ